MSVDVAWRRAVLDSAEVAPILSALHDPSPEVREAVFEAIIRLPLGPPEWREVGEYGKFVVDSSDSDHERAAVIAAVAYVPVRSFRERVAELLGREGPSLYQAATALAVLGDTRAVATLLRMFSGSTGWQRTEAARSLATVNVASARQEVIHLCEELGTSPEDVKTRFLLAVGLARSGDDTELRRLFDDLNSHQVDAWELHYGPEGEWQPVGFAPKELAGPPLPPETANWLEELGASELDFAPLARLILAASPSGPPQPPLSKIAPEWAGGRPPGFIRTTGPEAEQARARVQALGVGGAGGHVSRDAMTAARREGLAGVAVAVAFEGCVASGTGVFLSNEIVLWIAEFQREFQPDAAGLVHAYELCTEGGRAVRWQIGWAASRGGLRGLIAELAAGPLASADPAEKIAAAGLLADAADYASQGNPPLFGGGQGPSGPAVADEIVEDFPTAAAAPPEVPEPAEQPTLERPPETGERGSRAEPPEEAFGAESQEEAAEAESPEETAEAESGSARSGDRSITRRITRRITRGITRRAPHAPPPAAEPPTAELPSPREPRWLLARPWDASDPFNLQPAERAFRANTLHYVRVQIGPERPDMWRPRVGPAVDEVLPSPGSHDLTIVFQSPDGNDQSAMVTLPPTGATPIQTFRFRTGAPGGSLEAGILVLYNGRVLQKAVLSGLVVGDPTDAPSDARIDYSLTILRPGEDLDSRSDFDATIYSGTTGDGKTATSGIHGARVSRFDDAEVENVAESISAILTDLANNPDNYPPPLNSESKVRLLRQLAFQGRELYRAMGRWIENDLAGADLSKLQIVIGHPNKLVPIEFVYDLPAPATDARLCEHWLLGDTLDEHGRCSAEHPLNADGLATTVCPSGFWALSKVIERQIADRGSSVVDLQGRDFGVRSEPSDGRQHLAPLSSAVFAASENVDQVRPGLSAEVLGKLNDLTGNHATRAETWHDWIVAVRDVRPPLLVLLSHTEPAEGTVGLEIGTGDVRLLGQIDACVVRASNDVSPVVLLLGCQTALADRELATFVTPFRENGAALVVGTIAPVLGEHAAPVAERLATALHEAAEQGAADVEGATFGVLMRDIRRQLLAEGELMSMVLTAYGDADWRLSGG